MPKGIYDRTTDSRRTVQQRFEQKFVRGADDACWLWTAYVQPSTGYGRFGVAAGDVRGAHVVAHLLYVGEIPAGHDVDHVYARGCRYRHCVNPHHLEAVPHQVNIQRGMVGRKTHCKHGHSLADALVHHGRRECRECNRLRCADYNQRTRGKAA